MRVNGQACVDVARRLQPGMRVEVRSQPTRASPAARRKTEKPVLPQPSLVHLDAHIVVAEKPPGVTTMRHAEEAAEFGARGKRYLPPTLADALPRLVGGPVRAVHRLDRDTSGLVVFARTPEAEASLGKQFRAHTVGRRYLALVRGRPAVGRIESHLVRDRGDGRRGSGPPDAPGAQRAVTQVRVVEELGPFTLVECRLETGRTHQVRIHLGEAGTPLCGEKLYDRPLHGAPLPDGSGAGRTALHAAYLGLTHPANGKSLEWESPLPEDMAELVRRWRR